MTAQKNFFAIVTLVACILAFAPAEVFLFLCLNGKSDITTLAVANIFGISAAIVALIGVFKNVRLPAFAWVAANCAIAPFFGWSAFASLFGGGVLAVFTFALFVIAIIHYEDIGTHRV